MNKLNPVITLTPQQLMEREEMIQRLVQSPDVKLVMNEYGFTESFVRMHPARLQRLLDTLRKCEQCQGLHTCTNPQKGVYTDMKLINGRPMDEQKECRYLEKWNEKYAHKKYYVNCTMPKELLDADLYKLNMNDGYTDYDYMQIIKVLLEWVAKEDRKGLYLYGGFGVGKTYLAACLTNYLAKEGYDVTFLNTSEFCNTLRERYSNTEIKIPQVQEIQDVDVLVLDDIGAETVTNWIRDDVLYPLLNYRMTHNLLTLFTSNLNLEQLQEHFSINNKREQNDMNAQRLMERIKVLSDFVYVKGKNRRF